ncbi:MAG: hypothetical protein ACR2HE_04010 [Casimicrobiaceae bacterium]
MNAPMSEGLVTLNAEGKRFTAVFRIERDVITVTSGSVSAAVELRDVISPQSIARTILRTMVREGRAAERLSEPVGESSRGTIEFSSVESEWCAEYRLKDKRKAG